MEEPNDNASAGRGMPNHRGIEFRALAAVALMVAILAAVGSLFLRSSAVEPPADAAIASPLGVFAGIPPVAYLVERVGGDRVRVGVLVKPGQDPHIFEPTPRQVMALSRASLFFKIGMPFEDRLVDRVAQHHPRLRVIDTTRGIAKRAMADDDDEAGEPDPHVWLAPPLLKIMAANIAEALSGADPAGAGAFRGNLVSLTADLDALDARIARTLAPYRGQSFYVFHPAFGYFGDTYGLRQQSVEVEGKSPSPRQLQRLIRSARADGVKIIFLQSQFDPRSAEAVARAIDGVAEPMDSLAKNVVANLDTVAAKVATALGATAGLSSSAEHGGSSTLLDTPAAAPVLPPSATPEPVTAPKGS